MFSSLGTKIALRKAGLGNVSLPKTDGLFGNGNTKKGNINGADGGDTGFANPFANVQWGVPKALQSWTTPPPPQNPIRKPPNIGDRAQTHPKLQFPTADGRPTILLFLRFCGCPCKHSLSHRLRTSIVMEFGHRLIAAKSQRNSSSRSEPSQTATLPSTSLQYRIARPPQPQNGSRNSVERGM
jgi:hypothetical protein